MTPPDDPLGGTEAVCPECKGAVWLKRYRNGVNVLGGSDLIACSCQSEHLSRRAFEKARAACGLPRELGLCGFSTYDRARQPEAFAAARAFAGDPQKSWLVLLGEVGTGKSHLLAAIANQLLTTPHHPVYRVVGELLADLRQGYDAQDHHERWEQLKSAEVLLLDDYGVEKSSDWTIEVLTRLVDSRYAERLPLAVATNLQPDQMPPRIRSRLLDAARSRVIVMRQGDYRQSTERRDERKRPPQRPPQPWDARDEEW